MAASWFHVLSLFSVLFSVSWASSNSVEKIFLQCLSNHAQPSYPISGVVYTPNTSSFTGVLQEYAMNKRFITPATPKPLVIVAASHESHVQAVVVCAKCQGLEIRIRSGGHDYEGLSYTSRFPFVLLDMFNLRSITIDVADESAWAQTGATVGELYYAIGKKSKTLAFPAGAGLTMGLGGHISGGGYGNLLRKYGLSVDNIIDAKLVNANGTVLNRESMGEDLFWAIRGGGGASFGVILSWKLKLVRVPEVVTFVRTGRTLDEGATEIVHQWMQVTESLSEDLFIRLMPQVARIGDQKTVNLTVISLFLGPADKLKSLLKEHIPSLLLQPSDYRESSWVETTARFADYPPGTPLEVLLNRAKSPVYFKYKSDYVRKPISKEEVELIWKKMMELGDVYMQWNPYGKRMGEIAESATPFPHRAGILFKIQYLIKWTEAGEEASDRNIDLVRRLYDFMAPLVSNSPRESFLNYRDLDIGNTTTGNQGASVYGAMYFKSNFERLVRVKSVVDPHNFFRNEQSIPTRLP